MTDEQPINLKIDLRPNGREEVFKHVSDLETWIEREKEFWTWPEQLKHDRRTIIKFIAGYPKRLESIQGSINNLKSKQKIGDRPTLLQALETQLVNSFVHQPGLLHSSLPRAKYVKKLIAENPTRAAYALAFYLRKPVEHDNPDSLDGAFAALLFDFNIQGGFEGQKAALEELHNDWRKLLIRSKDQQEAFESEVSTWNQEAQSQKVSQQKEFLGRWKLGRRIGRHVLNKEKGKLRAFEKVYYEKLALSASVTYWTSKAKAHRKRSALFVWLVLSSFAAVGFGLHLTISEFARELTLANVTLRQFALLAIVATVGVWSIRILVRIMLSNIHLYNDAKEREVMLLTYLALLEEGKLPKEDSRELILQALFRPSSTGIVKDDAAPPFMAEWLKRTTGTD